MQENTSTTKQKQEHCLTFHFNSLQLHLLAVRSYLSKTGQTSHGEMTYFEKYSNRIV